MPNIKLVSNYWNQAVWWVIPMLVSTLSQSDTYGLPYTLQAIIRIVRLYRGLVATLSAGLTSAAAGQTRMESNWLLFVCFGFRRLRNPRCFGDLGILEMDALPDRERCEVADRAGPDGAESRDLYRANRQRIVWRNVILIGLIHAGALYSVLLIPKAHPFTWIWCKSANKTNFELLLCSIT